MTTASARRAIVGLAVTLWSLALPRIGVAQDFVPSPPSPPTPPPSSGRTPIKVIGVKFEDFGDWDIEPHSGRLRFTLFGDTTRPHSQILIHLSRRPADDEDEVELNVWLVDSAGREIVKMGPDATLEPWIPLSTAMEDARRDVDWVWLRPTMWDSLPTQTSKRGVFRIRVVAATAPKAQGQSPRFVLVDGDRP